MAKATEVNGKKPRAVSKEDYFYAREVAGQPAKTPQEVIAKTQAKMDIKNIEKKYPYIRKAYDVKGTTVAVVNKTYSS